MKKPSQQGSNAINELTKLYEELEESSKVLDLVLDGQVKERSTAIYLVSLYRARLFGICDELGGILMRLRES